MGKNKVMSTSNRVTGTKLEEQLEIKLCPTTYCPHCKQLYTHCHMNVYSDYIPIKVFFNHMNKTEYPGNNVIHKDCEIGYKEIRRVV